MGALLYHLLKQRVALEERFRRKGIGRVANLLRATPATFPHKGDTIDALGPVPPHAPPPVPGNDEVYSYRRPAKRL